MASKKGRSARPKGQTESPGETAAAEAHAAVPAEPTRAGAGQATQDQRSKAFQRSARDRPRARRSMDPLVAICAAVLLISSAVVLAATIDDKFFPEKDTSAATSWDRVKVDYVGSYHGYYDQGGMVFDTSIGGIGGNAGYIKAYDYGAGKTYDPLEFVIGQGSMLRMFENALLGMKPGESKRIVIPVGEGYGDGTSLKSLPSVTGVEMDISMSMSQAECAAYIGTSPMNNLTVTTPYGWEATVIQDSGSGAWVVTHAPAAGTSYTPKGDTSDSPAVKYKVTEITGTTLKFDYEFSPDVDAKMNTPAGWHVKALNGDGKTMFLYGSTETGSLAYQYKYPLTEKDAEGKETSVEKSDVELYFEIRFVGYA